MARLPNFLVIIRSEKLSGKGQGRGAKKRTFRFGKKNVSFPKVETFRFADYTRRASIPLQHGAHRIGNRTDADMERWRQHGLGQFIHWGVYAIPGGFWEGKCYPVAAEWIRSWKEMPKDEIGRAHV